jgi:thioredoxin reductase (NADPH)
MCKHLKKLEGSRDGPVRPSSEGCQECLAHGDAWVHLRLCMTCGHVGCCDSSPNRHATRHFHATKHPVVKSFEPGEEWAWCFEDEDLIDSIATFPVESPPEHYVSPGGAR